MIQRAYFKTIAERIDEPRKFILIIEGPRQVGKCEGFVRLSV